MQQSYDGNGLRVKKNENGAQTYYRRSSVLGGQVVAEIMWASVSWQRSRGYVYLGSQLLAVQSGGVYWMHEDPVTKSKRVTNSAGTVVSTVETDPWGADTARSSNAGSYSLSDPQSFNRYVYVQNDPVTFVDPTGLVQICVTLDNGETQCFDDGEAVTVYDGGPDPFDDPFFTGYDRWHLPTSPGCSK